MRKARVTGSTRNAESAHMVLKTGGSSIRGYPFHLPIKDILCQYSPMKTLTAVCLTFAVLLGTAGVSWGADYQKGVTAYQRGDYITALRVWKSLAEQGNVQAQNNIGVMYRSGLGISKDDKNAVKWFRLAAEHGDTPAQANLAYMYANGMGVLQDWVYAHMWSNVAASTGFMGAVKNREIFRKRMTPFQLAKAKQLARECIRKKYKGC